MRHSTAAGVIFISQFGFLRDTTAKFRKLYANIDRMKGYSSSRAFA
jgi:hypothetical protein